MSVNQIWLDNLKGEEIAEIFQNDITLAAERSITVLVIHSSNDNAPPVSNIGLARLAIPCAMSSVLESWRVPITPSATVAESSDSMAPSSAMENAAGSKRLIVSKSMS